MKRSCRRPRLLPLSTSSTSSTVCSPAIARYRPLWLKLQHSSNGAEEVEGMSGGNRECSNTEAEHRHSSSRWLRCPVPLKRKQQSLALKRDVDARRCSGSTREAHLRERMG